MDALFGCDARALVKHAVVEAGLALASLAARAMIICTADTVSAQLCQSWQKTHKESVYVWRRDLRRLALVAPQFTLWEQGSNRARGKVAGFQWDCAAFCRLDDAVTRLGARATQNRAGLQQLCAWRAFLCLPRNVTDVGFKPRAKFRIIAAVAFGARRC